MTSLVSTPMTVYSDPESQYSHRVRYTLAEKEIKVDQIDVPRDTINEDLYEFNPDGTTPTLVDRDVSVFMSTVIMEYLDERYPHPPLMPAFPVDRSRARITIFQLQDRWSKPLDILLGHPVNARKPTKAQQQKAYKDLRESIVSMSRALGQSLFLLGDDISLADCVALPVLWRLESVDITLPPIQTKHLREYMLRMFDRPAWRACLSDEEKELRE